MTTKYRIAEVCLQSFRRSLGDLRVKIWVLLDNCPPQYAAMFRRYFAEEDLVLEPLPGIGNKGTFDRQIEILANQEDADLVYFAEDDYFYLPDQFRLMTEFIQNHADADFVTPYDRLDYYTSELHRRRMQFRISQGHHWRTACSTCLTFLTTRVMLRKTQKLFQGYDLRNDCAIWLSLTKENVWRAWDFLRWCVRKPFFAKQVVRAWLVGFLQILLGKRRNLWLAVPAVATHLDFRALSPGVDWVALMEAQELPQRDGDEVNISTQ